MPRKKSDNPKKMTTVSGRVGQDLADWLDGYRLTLGEFPPSTSALVEKAMLEYLHKHAPGMRPATIVEPPKPRRRA